MNKRRRLWVEHLKTLLILLLSLSAIYLLLRTNLMDSASGGDGLLHSFTTLFSRRQEPVATPTEQTGGLVHPVRMVVTNPQTSGRCGLQYDQEALDNRFSGGLLNLFSDALSDAGAAKKISASLWKKALVAMDRPGIYVDLLGSIPGEQLPVWLGGRAANANLTGQVRRLLLTTDESGGVVLYYNNETDGSYYACATSFDLSQRLSDAVAEFEPNNAIFAFEDLAQYSGLEGHTLIQAEPPRPVVYNAANPIAAGTPEQVALIQDLGFHPQTNAVTLNDLVVREGVDTLRVSPTGVVSFYSATPDSPRYPVGDEESAPTDAQMVSAAWSLVERSMTPRVGAARLMLYGLAQEDGGTAIYFAYVLDGVAVQVGSDGYAARILLSEGRIAAFTLQLRRYEESGQTSIVLPEVQAAAAMEALDAQGGELLLCYLDQRGDRLEAGWISK